MRAFARAATQTKTARGGRDRPQALDRHREVATLAMNLARAAVRDSSRLKTDNQKLLSILRWARVVGRWHLWIWEGCDPDTAAGRTRQATGARSPPGSRDALVRGDVSVAV